MTWPLRGEGGKGLVTKKKYLFFNSLKTLKKFLLPLSSMRGWGKALVASLIQLFQLIFV